MSDEPRTAATALETNTENIPQIGNPFEDENSTQDQENDSTGKNPFSGSEENTPAPSPVITNEGQPNTASTSRVPDPVPSKDFGGDQLALRAKLSSNFPGNANDREWASFKDQPGKTEGSDSGPAINITRVWFCIVTVMGMAMFGFTASSSNRMQYLNYRIGRDEYNYTGDTSDNDSTDIQNDIQEEVSQILIYISLATGLPSIVLSLIVGSYSDSLGRRPLLTLAVFGCFMRSFSLAAVSYFDIPVWYLYLGGFIEGMTGTLYTAVLAMTALLADITPVLTARATRFAILQGTLFIGAALAQLTVGYMIEAWSYAIPAWVATGLEVCALIVTLFAVPETQAHVKKGDVNWNPIFHLKKALGFYFAKSHGQRRALYIIGLIIYLQVDVINSGRLSVEILYFLNVPISWNSVDIGIFESIRLIIWSVAAMVVLKLVRVRYPLEATGIAAALSLCASLVLQSLAQSGWWLYVSAAAGFLCAATFPIPKALLSRITSPKEQGALFSSLAFVDCLADMVSSTFCTFVYQQTLETFSGAVFMLLAGFAFLITIFTGVYWLIRRHLPAVVLGEANFQAKFRAGSSPEGLPPNFPNGPPPGPSSERQGQNERTPLLS